MNILFTCAGRRTYLLEYFRLQLDPGDKIVATDANITAPALTAADFAIEVPPVYASDYIDELLEICIKFDIKGIIPLNDLELPILSANIERFKERGIIPIISNQDVIDISFDKFKTANFIEKIGLKSPKTFTRPEEAENALKNGDIAFPLLLKPRWGSGSIGIEIVSDLEELRFIYKRLMKKVKKSILAKASIGDNFILIQEVIDGQEYGVDIMNDFDGKNRGVSVKKKLSMRAGETDKAMTVDKPEIVAIAKKIAKELRHIGNLDVDIFEKNGEYYVLELNPRFGGGFPFSFEAGANFPKAIVEWLKGNEIDDSILVPTTGLTFAKCDRVLSVRN